MIQTHNLLIFAYFQYGNSGGPLVNLVRLSKKSIYVSFFFSPFWFLFRYELAKAYYLILSNWNLWLYCTLPMSLLIFSGKSKACWCLDWKCYASGHACVSTLQVKALEFRFDPGPVKWASLYFEGVSSSGLPPSCLRSWLGSSTGFVLARTLP